MAAFHILSLVYDRNWVPQERAKVRACLSCYLICLRHEGPLFRLPRMPPWLRQRVPESLPFQFVGLDYLGPVFVKEGVKMIKMWIFLFTCLGICAMHLECFLQNIFCFV